MLSITSSIESHTQPSDVTLFPAWCPLQEAPKQVAGIADAEKHCVEQHNTSHVSKCLLQCLLCGRPLSRLREQHMQKKSLLYDITPHT